ncbi:MAG: hypothetical protein ACLFV7_11810 [Phycisphaerae bacterium]
MKRTWIACTLAMAVLGGALPAAAAGSIDVEKKDRQVYNRLVGELREAYRQLAGMYDKAVVEARNNEGTASVSTRAKVLRLKDEIDLKSVRLMLVADRHGWEVPKFTVEQFRGQKPQQEISAADQLLPPDDARIARALEGQAVELASKIQLPVITLSEGLGGKAESDDDDRD